MDMVHRMNNNMKDGKNLDSLNDDIGNDLNFRLHENSAWINQLRQSHNNLCNNINNNHCDLCHTTSPDHSLKGQMELSKRKKTTSNINNRKNDLLEDSVNSFDLNMPCSCSSHLRNQKNHFCVYYNQSNSSSQNENYKNYLNWNPNSNNNLINNSIDKNDTPLDNSNGNSGRNLGDSNLLCISQNNNGTSSQSTNPKHLSQTIDMNQKQSSHTSQYSNNPNLQDIQNQFSYQNQPNINMDMHSQLNLIKQNCNYSPKCINNNKKKSTTGTSKDSTRKLLSSHSLSMPLEQQHQSSKKNNLSSSFIENNLCTKLNSIINFEWINNDLKMNLNGNKSNSYDNSES
ncbi:hypothetical protein PFLG_02346 [Plasmodium falciparum RAJ116]|nr:hypothetical protein PFLG_02346 [Plasmodium falciparum RAJ116]